ncbi:MAG: RAMP superfamily protein [Alkalinema sp. CACIAM 70d]|nr:MAG: RAMP superfamily protein [Alkalinema sp. CACIAM 70d]
MRAIPDAHQKVPMMFRAQVNGRCQIQRLVKGEEPDAVRWTDEWTSRVETVPSPASIEVQTRDCEIAWRLITNSGLDDGVIRPVIGAQGLPYFPGSSMKGMFRRACTATQADRYCGKPLPGNDWQPGILRFHGGYPIDPAWTEHLVDIVHPQQSWQVKSNDKEGGAFVQISLYKPTLRFGISSTLPLDSSEWDVIWEIWQQALAKGIGSRVAAGYGQVRDSQPTVLHKSRVKGQGQAPKLITQAGEFRPNMFRASLRGHALRIFGGLTDATTAERLVENLFGGIQGREGTIGLLGLKFVESKLSIDSFGSGSYAQPCYDVEGDLIWYLARSLNDPAHEPLLKKLVASLMQFAMVFGGFGKSWRRADHRKFFEEYYDDSYKALIGCHWQWLDDPTLRRNVKVWRLAQVAGFVEQVQTNAQEWMRSQGVTPKPNHWAQNWREALHPANVQVWGREAADVDSSEAIRWFHGAYRQAIPGVCAEGTIYKTDFVGKVSQVGKLWHRMYPVVELKKNPDDPKKPVIRRTPKYLEILTIFPDGSNAANQFLDFLENKPFGFEQLWGEETK